MNLLILTGPLYPQRSNNANLLLKLLPELAKYHSVTLAAPAGEGRMPETIEGFPVRWLRDKRDLCRRTVIPAIGRLTDRGGYSDMVQALVLRREHPGRLAAAAAILLALTALPFIAMSL